MATIADYSQLLVNLMIYNKADAAGGLAKPVRHSEVAGAAGAPTFELWTRNYAKIEDYLSAYEALAETMEFGTGWLAPIWNHFTLLCACTFSRLVTGAVSITGLWEMKCYDNLVADLYLEDAEGIYKELDVFSWPGLLTWYGLTILNNAILGAQHHMFIVAGVNLMQLIFLSKPYGDYNFKTPYLAQFGTPLKVDVL